MNNLDSITNFIEKQKIGLHQYFFLACWADERQDLLERYANVIPPYEHKIALMHDVLIEDLITKKLLVSNGNLINPEYAVGEAFIEHLKEAFYLTEQNV